MSKLGLFGLLCLGIGSCVQISPACAQVLADSVLVPVWAWDFGGANCVCEPCSLGCSPNDQTPRDFGLGYVFSPPIGWAIYCPSGCKPLGEIPIDSVDVAPADGYSESIDALHNQELSVGRTYVLKTMGGGHALMTPLSLSFSGMTFVYKFQPDGTGVFDRTPVSRMTWGGIKRVYLQNSSRH